MPRNKKSPKFTIGPFIASPDVVVESAKTGKWIWFGTDRHARVYAATWIVNMNFGCVMNYIARKQLAVAMRNPECPYVFRARFMEAIPSISEMSEWWVTCSEIPSAQLRAATRDAAVEAACYAAAQHVGGDAKVHVIFEVPATKTRIPALLTQ